MFQDASDKTMNLLSVDDEFAMVAQPLPPMENYNFSEISEYEKGTSKSSLKIL